MSKAKSIPMSTTTEIRQSFLDFFASKNHNVVASSSLVPHNDPTLMFTNAGMNQFKNVFTGVEKAPEPPRAVSSQKCVRAGGKHNDLDNVGYTTRHHTFFEMLGNFSFGDYFKEEAIAHAWELLTKTYKIPPEKLGFTVYHTDDEAFNIWKKVTGCADEKILRVPTTDNFWSMGDTGPCGPCSEIFYDHGVGEGEWKLDADGYDMFGSRYVEIWNLVFMQYEQVDADTRIDLPKPCVDTGMGLERIAAVLQGTHDNYNIDLFQNLIRASEALTHTKAEGEHAASHKVIADHLRSSCFLIADGVLPSNEGRGYVLRRIMRRAMRHAHLLGCAEPLMHRLVPALIREMGDHFSELKRAESLMIQTLEQEEIRFKKTLDRGLKLLEEERSTLSSGGQLSGDTAFKLYDTYGFPLDLTQDILRGAGQSVDLAGFDAAMAEQKARARAAWAGSGDGGTQALWYDLKERCGASEFLGYVSNHAQAEILALIVDGAEVPSMKAGQSGQLIVNQTPFYAESGGQVGDTGSAKTAEASLSVTDTKKPVDGLHVHFITVDHGDLKVGDVIDLAIDETRRSAIRANHSATHLLHAALRNHLGDHITQKGSLVDAERLRFDISHPQGLTEDEIQTIEADVNRMIWHNSDVGTKLMTPDEAIEAGAMALFGEKYGDEVRVLSMGENNYSVELCGGTHVHSTGDIGLFKIISESAIAAGIRRIEAITQKAAFDYLSAQDCALRALASDLKSRPEEVAEKVAKLAQDKKSLEKQLADTKKQLAMGGAGGSDDLAPQTVSGMPFIGKSFSELPPKDLRDLVTSLAQKHADAVIALGSSFEGKASIIVASGQPAIDAPTLVRAASAAVGGQGGGGKPAFAQAGGPDGDKIDDAITAVRTLLGA